LTETDDLILAAGGVLFRSSPDGGTLFAIVHKVKYGEWCLPKGKRKQNESWKECALREVLEETGMSGAIIDGPAATSSYIVDGTPKIVVWFVIKATHEHAWDADSEIDSHTWLSANEVRRRLSHAAELAVFDSIASEIPVAEA
jgi:8-oxo-dGTP pyrophosphatase MutT (NUDIX family)